MTDSLFDFLYGGILDSIYSYKESEKVQQNRKSMCWKRWINDLYKLKHIHCTVVTVLL